jgi:hypothetical protein
MRSNFFAILCVSGAGFVWGGQPWDSAFSSDTRGILAVASRISPAEHPEVLILMDDHRYFIHSDGRIDLTFRRVYRIEGSGRSRLPISPPMLLVFKIQTAGSTTTPGGRIPRSRL